MNAEKIQNWEDRYNKLLRIKERVEKEIAELKSEMMDEAVETGEFKFEGERMSFQYFPERVQNRFDSSTFKEEHPKLFENYLVESTYEPMVRISSKEKALKSKTVRKKKTENN